MLKQFLKIKKLLGSRSSGNFGSLLHGSGIDIAENRKYVAGDEKRSINRKMSAKYNELFVNLFHEEKTLEIHICCDTNYNRRGENTETFLWFFIGLTEYFSSGKAHITGWLGTKEFPHLEKIHYQKPFLDAYESVVTNSLPLYQSSLREMLHLQHTLPKRRLIIIVSDFLSYDEEEKRYVRSLREKHDVTLLCVESYMPVTSGMITLSAFRN